MAAQINIGIVGAGAIVRSRHMPGLTAIDDAAVTAVCNRSAQSGRKFADEYGVPHVLDNWKDLVARDDIQVVWIGT